VLLAGLGLARAGGAGGQDGPWEPSLAGLDWMSGHWQQRRESGLVEELWMPPRGGMMLGLNRTVRDDLPRGQFEYLRIEETKDGVFYMASPSGGKPTPFELVEGGDGHALFVNPEHDFPKRIEYALDGKGHLVVSIGADEPGPSWRFVRAGDVD
jgi:hypothetical protein